jgi:LPXTG-site transpeptidase (sortase) family protein
MLNLPLILNSFKYSPKASDTPGPQVATYQELQTTKMADSAPLSPGEVVPATNTIVIPKIGVNAPVIFLNSRDEKTIEANLANGVVHYQGTANPGEVGNTFITGHSSNFWWIQGQYNYVFVNLDKLAVGDQTVVYYNGKKFVYQVTGTKVVLPTDTSVLAPTDTPTLTLMTCTPAGTNWKRLIVSLDQVSPTYVKPVLVTKQVVVTPSALPSLDSNSAGGIWSSIVDFVRGIFNS